jgi:hypothetical protein
MQVLVYEMQMNDFGKSILENDPSFKVKVIETLGDEDDILPLYRVRVTETREHEDGDGEPEWVELES